MLIKDGKKENDFVGWFVTLLLLWIGTLMWCTFIT